MAITSSSLWSSLGLAAKDISLKAGRCVALFPVRLSVGPPLNATPTLRQSTEKSSSVSGRCNALMHPARFGARQLNARIR
jgi:hypothetical protein